MTSVITRYTSPRALKNPRVFSKKSLIELIKAWNKYKPDKISYKESETVIELSDKLNEKMKPVCDDKQFWCWPTALQKIAKDDRTKQIMKMIADYELRPEMPREWSKNPIEWLSNFDIEAVMKQYNDDPTYSYAFLGVFPIDFSEEDKFGRCLYSHICNLNTKKYKNKGIKYLGLITNLDKHNQSGSHWTSTFIVLDPRNKSYGAHYYDSTARQIPAYVVKFMNNIKKQCHPHFRITYNNLQHQRKNTECGMFSMVYQIRWLNFMAFHKKMKTSNPYTDKNLPNAVVSDSTLTDDVMVMHRKYLFRPNFEDYMSTRKIKI